ncbi:hypothetical protein DEO72_LG6g613 [Vigna unguiculata]|uniref:Uncharacterized protein n=1 Tax=Vigna unguiculata TaxID=3917 RepID=A0A4D6M425_VIGUN|nr:hypothetical protein DEO72_LG6g613 [Vigna unguiculata]
MLLRILQLDQYKEKRECCRVEFWRSNKHVREYHATDHTSQHQVEFPIRTTIRTLDTRLAHHWPQPVIAQSSGHPPYKSNSDTHTGTLTTLSHNSMSAYVHPPSRVITQGMSF